MAPIGKVLVIAGLALAGAGFLIILFSKVGWIGRLPGDTVIERKNFTFYFPIATCILLSLLLSLVAWLFRR